MADTLAASWPAVLHLLEQARQCRDRPRTDVGQRAFTRDLDRVAAAAAPLIAHVYAPLLAAVARGPLTLAQAGQSLDGRVATHTGHSHYVNGSDSLDHLHRLRALVDAVVVGAGTVAADDPRLTVRRVAGANPVRVVIDPRRRLTAAHRVFDATAPTLVVCRADIPDPPPGAPTVPAVARVAVAASDDGLAPRAILDALHRRGLRTVLIEGGPTTVSAFLGAGLIDRLHVAVAPLIIGSGRCGFVLPPVERIDEALRVEVRGVYRLGTDILVDCRPAPGRDDHAGHTAQMST